MAYTMCKASTGGVLCSALCKNNLESKKSHPNLDTFYQNHAKKLAKKRQFLTVELRLFNLEVLCHVRISQAQLPGIGFHHSLPRSLDVLQDIVFPVAIE